MYFLNSAQDLYLSSLLTTLLYFCALKTLHALLYLLRSRGWVLLELYRLLRDQSRWWNLLVATLEANCVVLVFDCALQLLSLGCLCPFDRANNVVMFLLLFCLFWYILCFYALVRSSERRRCAKTLIVYTRHKFGSYLLEPILILARSALRAFAHGFLLADYPTQMAALFVLNLPFLLLSLIMRKHFHNCFVFCFMTSYLAGFAFLDLFFLAEVNEWSWFAGWDRELVCFVMCCILVGLSMLLSLALLGGSFYDLYVTIK